MARRAIRIANCSGAIGDGIDQIYRLALAGGIDAITADYLAEFNIAWRAIDQQADPSTGYEPNFLQQLAWHDGDAARLLAEKKIKVVHDGGALNPQALAEAADSYFRSLGITTVRIAWVTGDNVTQQVKAKTLDKDLKHLDLPGVSLTDDDISVMLTANAYTGQAGVVAALQEGADIVVCGRCTDASPVMGLASWWHGWDAGKDYDALAGSLIAGHVIECGPMSTGGNFAGIYEFPQIFDLGFPIVEIDADGSFVVTKNAGTGGAVTVDTVTAQLLYEIQGPFYLNPDVTLHMESIAATLIDKDRVRITGVRGSPPPPTTKLAVCLLGGYQAELATFAVGLDTEAKFQQMKTGVLQRINKDDFSVFSIERYGSSPADPKSQASATVMIRFFAQSPKKEALAQMGQGIFFNGLQGYCGMHAAMDWRTLAPKPYVRYFPALVSQSLVPLQVHLMPEGGHKAGDAVVTQVPARDASLCANKAAVQPTYESTVTAPVFDKTVRRPLGDLVFARSGDKGGNANIGFWVRDDAAYPWLQSFLTTDRAKELLGNDWKDSYKVERCEFPKLRAVHILVRGLLQDGVSSSSIVDGFGKSVGEFMRARHVDLPVELVEVEDKRRTEAYAKVGRTYSPSG